MAAPPLEEIKPQSTQIVLAEQSSRPKPAASLGSDFAIWPEKIRFGGGEWRRVGANVTNASAPGTFSQNYQKFYKNGESANLHWTLAHKPESETVTVSYSDKTFKWNGTNQWPIVPDPPSLPKTIGPSYSWPE
jgi:hypothetical protein